MNQAPPQPWALMVHLGLLARHHHHRSESQKKQAMVLEKSCVGSESEDSISHMISDPPTICYANNNLFESMHINNQDGLEFVNWSSADDNHFEIELEKIDSALLAHDESLLFQGLEVGASLSRSSDTTQHDWIPQYYDELVPGYKLVRSASIKVTNGMPIGDGIIHPLNLAESKALLGPNGVMRTMCPAWQTKESNFNKSRTKKPSTIQHLVVYKCDASGVGCIYEIKFCRCEQGILAYQEQEHSEHSQHHIFPTSGRCNSLSLNCAQKCYIIRNWGNRSRQDVLLDMMEGTQDEDIKLNHSQTADLQKFRTVISQFITKQKSKRFKHHWHRNAMTTTSMVHILQLLRSKNRVGEAIPTPSFEDGSDLFFNSMWENLIVLDHDYSNEKVECSKTFIIAANIKMAEIIHKAGHV